jgi:hypothetical protein
MNMWLSKKKGSTFFDLMTMSEIAYTVARGSGPKNLIFSNGS